MNGPTRKSKKKLKYAERNENENTIIPNLWDAAEVALREKYVTIWAYLKKQEKSQINNLTLFLKKLDKEQQMMPKACRREEIIKITEERNDTETKNKTKKTTDQWNKEVVVWKK